MAAPISDITHVIQLSVAPVFLLTAVATLINAMNARLGRSVDRRRVLTERLDNLSGDARKDAEDELVLLHRRTRFVYFAILSVVLSGLLVSLVVALAFVGALANVALGTWVAGLFVAAMFFMTLGLGFMAREVYLAVQASDRAHPLRSR
jgi:Protein of unknown function (DUF2721)